MSGAPNAEVNADSHSVAGGWRVLTVAAILILAALGAYWNSFNVPFLLDDGVSIGDNSSIRHLERITDVLNPPPTALTTARPLLNLTYAVNYAGGGLSVRGYHAVNLFIHICAGLTLFGIVRRTLLLPGLRAALTPHPSDMGGTPMPRGTGVPPVGLGCGTNAPLRRRFGEAALPLAACVALLWTLHPLQTESVTYISQRAESLMGLFYLVTLYGFIRSVSSVAGVGRGRRTPPLQASILSAGFGDPALQQSAFGGSNLWLGLSVLACFCGMATKQVMVTAPVLVLLYDRAFVSGSFRSALTNRRWYYANLAATWLLLGYLVHHSSLAVASVGFQVGVNWQTYALTELGVVAKYLKLAFWPHPLVFDYGTEIFVTGPLAAAPDALIIAAILIGVAIAWRRWPMAGFLGAWFFLILAPTSTVVPIAEQPMAESRVYLPLAGMIVLVTLLSYAFGHRKAFVVLGFIAVGLGVLTVRRNYDYRSELIIWEDTLAKHPNSSRGHSNLGMAFAKIPGQLPAAIAHYEEAMRIKPTYVDTLNNLANALAKMPGRSADAIAHYETAVRLQPDLAITHYNLAVALAQLPGRMPDAIAQYEEALRLKPTYAEAHTNLASALAEMPGRLADAIAHYAEALRLQPGLAEAHYNFAVTLARIPGRTPDAVAHYEEAIRLAPGLVEAHNNLATVLAEMPGRLPDAIAHYETALRLKPDNAEAQSNLGITLARIPERLSGAVTHCEEAVRLKPDSVDARTNLAMVYAEIGRLEAAIEQLEIAARLNPASTAIRDNLEKLKAMRQQ